MSPPTVPLRVLDTDVDVHVLGNDPEPLVAGIRARWHLCLRKGPPASREPVAVEVLHGPSREAAGDLRLRTRVADTDEDRLHTHLTQAVTGAVIRAQSGRLLLLHAAALAHPRTGASLVAVAPGGTGKSTLCATVGGPERSYLTDETVGIRRDGGVAAYPKPVSMRRRDGGGKAELAPGSLGLSPPAVEPWVAGVVLLARHPRHRGAPDVEELDTLTALTALAPETSALMVTERPLTWLAEVLETTGGARRVTYADTTALLPLVDETLGRTR